MAVRVALVPPLTMPSGVYWLMIQASGQLSSGPWAPPLTVAGQSVTGNGKQRTGLSSPTWGPTNSGTVALGGRFVQGFPFKLFGTSSLPLGAITNAGLPACGSITVSVAGAPVVGGFIRTDLHGVTGIGVVGYGFATVLHACGCTLGHDWTVAIIGSGASLIIPTSNTICGLGFGIQGADLGGIGGCGSPMLSLTETMNVSIQ